jgi:hypothetical protein
MVCLAVREVSGRVNGNTFNEPSGRVSNYFWLILLVIAYVSWPLVEGYIVRGRSLVQLLSVALCASFFLSAAVTLAWLITYERRNGPVYVVRP